ncbi:MAG TPA: fasciclin domain-containing protein, partial [Thermoleophilaceae bacterium]
MYSFTPTRLALVLATTLALSVAVVGPASAASAGPAAKRANIVKTATDAGQFKTLVSLVKRAGLAGTLAAKSARYTVFAPTDAAFKKVPKRTIDALLKDPAKLRAVLLHHVVKGRVTAKQVVKVRSVQTLNGDSLRLRVRGGK